MSEESREAHARTWRVRLWIRLSAVLVVGLLSWQQADVIRRASRGAMPQTEVRDGNVVLVVLAVFLFLIVFRPMVRIDQTGDVYVRNPLGSRRFRTENVKGVSIDGRGLVISLTGDLIVRSIVFQGTQSFSEPRWFDVAEALTGVRPVPHTADDDSPGHDSNP